MKGLFVVGSYGSGKTALCLGLALIFREQGLRVGYFKPIGVLAGVSGKEDEDVALMREVLGIIDCCERMVVLHASHNYLSRYQKADAHLRLIKECYDELAADRDVVIMEGTTFPHVMASLGLDAGTIARQVGAVVLVVGRAEDDFSADRMILFNEYVRSRDAEVAGSVFNNVPRPLLDKVRGVYKPLLEDLGHRVLGVVPRRVEIAAPTVREFCAVLGGELLAGHEHLDLLVEDVLVGAMTLESALPYLRRSANKAVITGGDRADLVLATLETSTSLIVLTGGLYPDVKVVARASQRGVPLLLVHYDTYTTIEKLHAVSRKIKPDQEEAIRLAKDVVSQYVDWRAILDALR